MGQLSPVRDRTRERASERAGTAGRRMLGRIDETAVREAYRRWAPVYDHTFGRFATEGRKHAVELINARKGSVLEVGVGTGLSLPAYASHLEIVGIDLSPAYLAEAEQHMRPLRPARLLLGNAEAMPLADASQDIVSSIFLFHELPREVRRRVAAEMARILKPGGMLVFIDSLQMGDRPGWDGLLEAFPVRFHEPYFRNYAIDDLDAVFNAAGLAAEGTSLAFLSKVMVRRKEG